MKDRTPEERKAIERKEVDEGVVNDVRSSIHIHRVCTDPLDMNVVHVFYYNPTQ